MTVAQKYFFLETIYSLALSFTKATFVLFFLSHELKLFEIGLLFGVFNLAVIIAEPITAIFADLYGRKRSLVIGCVLKIVAALIFVFGSHIREFLIAEIISGIAFTFISGCMMAWVVDEVNRVDKKCNLYELFVQSNKYKYVALIVGGLLGASLGDVSLVIPWAANGFFFVVLLVIVSVVLTENSNTLNIKRSFNFARKLNEYKNALQDKCLMGLIFSSFLSSFALASIRLFWLPTIKQNFGVSISFLGWLWVGIAGAGLLGAYFVRPYVKQFNYKPDGLILFSGFSTMFLFLMIFTMGSFWTFLFYFLFEFGKPLYTSVKSDLINHQISEDVRVSILSLNSLGIKLGTSVGLIVIGYISEVMSLEIAWYFSSSLFLVNMFLFISVRYWMLKIPQKKAILAVA